MDRTLEPAVETEQVSRAFAANSVVVDLAGSQRRACDCRRHVRMREVVGREVQTGFRRERGLPPWRLAGLAQMSDKNTKSSHGAKLSRYAHR